MVCADLVYNTSTNKNKICFYSKGSVHVAKTLFLTDHQLAQGCNDALQHYGQKCACGSMAKIRGFCFL